MKKVFICEDTVTGIYSGIYDAWKLRAQEGETGIALKGFVEQELFCEYMETETSEHKAAAVERLIRRHLGEEAYRDIYQAVLSNDEKKGDAILGTMLEARRIPDSRKIMQHLSHPRVQKVFELSRRVGNEAHYFMEFIRFRELRNGALFARVNPQNQILTCVAGHFANRLPLENWLIYDETHTTALVHPAGKPWILLHGEQIEEEIEDILSEDERRFEKLWRGFRESVSIAERENPGLQRQHFPLRYRKNVVEFTQEKMTFSDKN